MVKEVEPETLQKVMESWNTLKKHDDYERIAGARVMKFLLQKCPKAKPMFGYDIEADVDDDEFLKADRFVAHSSQLISMFDHALGMMGPDGKLLEQQIKELGQKHITYGVQAEMFPIMGKALMYTIEEELGEEFDKDLQDSWRQVFSAISTDLMKTVLAGRAA